MNEQDVHQAMIYNEKRIDILQDILINLHKDMRHIVHLLFFLGALLTGHIIFNF